MWDIIKTWENQNGCISSLEKINNEKIFILLLLIQFLNKRS